MAVSHYHSARSDLERTAPARHSEERHSALGPDSAPEGIRQIFAQQGFTDLSWAMFLASWVSLTL